MTESWKTASDPDLDSGIPTTGKDIRALHRNRPAARPVERLELNRFNVPSWLVKKEALRRVTVAGHPMFEL